MSKARADRLIDEYIESDPHRPGKANARLKGFGVPVWALAGYFATGSYNLSEIARDYELPCEAVEAALEYYKRHEMILDQRVDANIS